ncbi:hypothetical protein D1631_18420 [Chryseobacterium nematophagum]|uniref:Uncharacterized protein n=1 Tax=Chryseobacterium nematophagum TaxID=2305228 RepID=A0A3M7TCW5_9FLAO|nr:hypothetical protein D1631_18420 [Chryseobacterium nematophagum]
MIYRSNLEYKVKLVLLIGGLGIFVFSGYIPSLFGFENRNLGALRVFFSIFLMGILLYSTHTLSSLFRKSLLLCTLLLNIYSISIKNAESIKSVNEIATDLKISKITLYKYLRESNVEIMAYNRE